MAKRAAETYLTDQNFDIEQPKEEAGAFTVASEDVLHHRTILKAKRRCIANDDENGNNRGAFQSFPGLTGRSSVAKEEDVSTFSFRMPSASDSDAAQKCVKMNALNKCLMEYVSSQLSRDPSCNLMPVFNDYQSHASDISAMCSDKVDTPPSTSVAPPTSVTTAGGQVPLSQLFQKPPDTWECPTCMITNKDTASMCIACSCPKTTADHDVPTSSVQSTTSASSISFGAGGGFKFSLGSGQSSTTSFTGFSFKPPSTSTVASFSFGLPLSSAAAVTSADSSQPLVSTGFAFSLPPQQSGASTDSGSGSFSFGNTSGFSFKPQQPAATDNKGEGEDDAEYVPQKPESVRHNEEGSFYSVRCKLFCKADDSWKDRGTGYLFLKPCGDRTQLLIRADTATGNILLNILLTSSIPVSRQGSNNVSLVCSPTATAAQSSADNKAPICMLVRVKTSEMADELFSHISKCKDV